MFVKAIKQMLSGLGRSEIQAAPGNTPTADGVGIEIIVENYKGREVQRIVSSSAVLTIGRALGSTIQIEDASVSRAHARLLIGLDCVEVEDYSTNGTLMGDVHLHHSRVQGAFGLPIVIGTSTLRVRPLETRGRR